jgi:hypothetical protein
MIACTDPKQVWGGLKGDDSLGVFVGITNHHIHTMGNGFFVLLFRITNLRHSIGGQEQKQWRQHIMVTVMDDAVAEE